MRRRFWCAGAMVVVIAMLVGACTSDGERGLRMVSAAALPANVQSAPTVVRDAYRFAVANPDVMKRIPCYCGCGAMGHRSNYACYVASVDASGTVHYDDHAIGCSICVDITRDVMRLLRDGKSVAEIRSYVDGAYAKYGPSNML